MGRTTAGRTGPCCHCGTDSTPLWRQGPPEKPVLCNACGSRFRLKGTLENYVPKIMNNKNFQAGQNLNTLNKDSSLGMTGTSNKLTEGSESEFLSNKKFQVGRNLNILDKDLSEGTSGYTSSKLTSSSTSSGGIDPKSLWDVPIPSRERSQVVYKEMTPTETFHRQLLNVQKSDQEQPLQYESEDDVLIYNKWHFIPSNEIGLGCMLLDPADLPASSSSEKKSPKQA